MERAIVKESVSGKQGSNGVPGMVVGRTKLTIDGVCGWNSKVKCSIIGCELWLHSVMRDKNG